MPQREDRLNPIDTDTVKFFQSSSSNIPKSPYTVVSKTAMSYEATDRVKQLSQPKIRKDNLIRKGV